MPDINIKDQLKKLVDVQKIDAEIYMHRKELAEKPAHIETIKKQYEDKKSGLQALEDRYKRIQLQRKENELELQAKEGEIAKSNTQLSQIKTNKEYQAKITEIEHIKADKSLFEEKILKLFDEGDAIHAEIEKEKQFLAEEEKKYAAEKKKVEDENKMIQDKVSVLESKRKQLLPEIDRQIMARYERILANKEGLAMVPVQNNSCSGCFMNVPAQVINEIKMYDKVVICEMCSRILYLEDDL